MNRGMIYALTCYLLWGVLPIYWKALANLPALETTAHRIVWTVLFAAIMLAIRQRWHWLRDIAARPMIALSVAGAAALILLNWLIYIYAINSGQIVESSLGYYMNPLVNVMLAVLFLGERPRAGQWAAIGIAAAGVAYLTVTYGRLPWIALGLAFTFGFYALLKKTARLGALEGLFLEMLLLSFPATAYLVWREASSVGAFGHAAPATTLLLLLAGIVTGAPLLLFSAGARRVSLTVMGLLQYVSPTIAFVLGIALYHEPFSVTRLAGFSVIWVALAVFTLEGMAERRRLALALAQPH